MGGSRDARAAPSTAKRGGEPQTSGVSQASLAAGSTQSSLTKASDSSGHVALKLLHSTQVDRVGSAQFLSSESVFRDLLAGIDDFYLDVDAFFERIKIHELPCPGRRNDTKKSNVFADLVDCYEVPFDLRETEKAAWLLRSSAAGTASIASIQFVSVDANTCLSTMCVQAPVFNVQLTIHRVTRQYVEYDKTVFIVRSIVESNPELYSLRMTATIRSVLKRGVSSAIGPTTTLQTHCEVMNSVSPQLLMENGYVAWERLLTDFNNKLEDMLLRESAGYK